MMSSLILMSLLAVQERATTPGVTVMAWDLGEALSRFPLVTEGQTPNTYFVNPMVDFKDGLESQEGVLSDRFVGLVQGWIVVDDGAEYEFQLEADDGGRLFIEDQLIIDVERDSSESARFTAVGKAKLQKGLNAFRLPFYEDGGNFYVRLKWRKAGSNEAFSLVPTANLVTEGGQTFVVSPGKKRFSFDKPLFAAGDTRPLEGVHPAYELEDFRGKRFEPAVGGMCFLPDGRLAVCTWDPDGAVYLLDLKASPVGVKKFASGLGEPLGIAYIDGHLMVTQKGEVTRLVDLDGDDEADRYESVAGGWPVSHNYHEFTFNLVPLGGKVYMTSSVPLRGGWTNYMPGSSGAFAVNQGPGSWFEVDLKTGDWKRLARGLRTPNGMNLALDGQFFVCDNQGSWMPSSKMSVLRPGGFYGHQETPEGTEKAEPPVVWFPQGEIGNSPSQMVLVPDGEYRGQMLVGDVTHGGIKRLFVEKVGGLYQGAVFRFSQGIEAGVNRLVWGPDGCLYVGGIGSNGNWNHLNTKFGLQRLRYGGEIPFEMKSVRSVADGFVVEFTKPVDLAKLSGIEVRQWRYEEKEFYGGPKVDDEKLSVEVKGLQDGNRLVYFRLPGLKEGRVVYFRMKGLESAAGEAMWSTEAWYTLNKKGPVFVDSEAFWPARRQIGLHTAVPSGAEVLVGDGKLGMKLAKQGVTGWSLERGELAVNQKAGDMISGAGYGDVRLHVEWKSPFGGGDGAGNQMAGNGGVKLQGLYELQVLGYPLVPDSLDAMGGVRKDWAGAIYGVKAPDRNVSFGPEVWQTYDVWFRAPKFVDGKKVANARMTVYWNGVLVHDDVEVGGATGSSGAVERPGEFPLLLQAHGSAAEGEVRYRNVWVVRDPWGRGMLPPK